MSRLHIQGDNSGINQPSRCFQSAWERRGISSAWEVPEEAGEEEPCALIHPSFDDLLDVGKASSSSSPCKEQAVH